MIKTSLKITGIKEIDNCLNQMPLQLKDRTLQAAGVRAAKPLIEKAKLIAPEGPTGNLVDSIGAMRGSFNQVKSLQRELGAVTVGPRRGRGKGRKGYIAHIIEYGRKGRKLKNGKRGKPVAGKPFMEPAFQATRTQILSSYNEQVARVLLSTMKRTLKK